MAKKRMTRAHSNVAFSRSNTRQPSRTKSIIVLKRSMRPGFAGVDNDLYYDEKCMMLFGDAKESLTKLIGEMKSLL